MLREKVKVFRKLLITVDMGIIAGAFYLCAYLIRFFPKGAEFALNLWVLPLAILAWIYFLHRFQIYSSIRTRDFSELLYIILRAAFFGLLVLSIPMLFLKSSRIDRNFIAMFFLIASGLLSIEKILLLNAFRYIRLKGYNYRNILIIGFNSRVENFINIVKANVEWGLRVIGIVDQDASHIGIEINGVKVIGTFSDMTQIIHSKVIDEVVFIVPRSLLGQIEEIIHICETEGIRMSLAADFFNLKIAKARQSDLQGFPLLTFETISDKVWHLMLKRLFDLVVSALALILLMPLFILIALLIKLISPKGPVFFKQKRVGVNGRKFSLIKFRTMVPDAEAKLKDLLAKNEMNGPVFKMKDDPRIIPFIGKILRKFSLDEFPQFWNVFAGDMSLVGPRPPIPNEVTQYDNWQRRRFSMRPGLTCLWQINGRNKIVDFNEWMQLDLKYIDSWSLWLDCKIFLKTIPIVLLGSGAK